MGQSSYTKHDFFFVRPNRWKVCSILNFSIFMNIVTCQRGRVSKEPLWATGSDKTQGQGSFGSVQAFTGGRNLTLVTYKKV